VLALFAVLLNGCFIKSIAMNSVADGLADQGDVFSSDDDPELIRQAVPFSLKFMESILSATPHHFGLLTALAKNFTEYSYAYVKSESDYIADENYPKSQELKLRAKRLYKRALKYGLRALDERHDKFSQLVMTDPKAAAAKVTNKEEVDALYWTGVAWMAAISVSKEDPELMSEIPQAEALIYRAYTLEPDYDKGSIHEFLITYEAGKPVLMGGSTKHAKEHFDRAVELSKGQDVSAYLNYAEAVDLKQQNREEFEQMLSKALAIDPDKDPSTRLVNLIMQKRARWLLARADTLFVQ
jgi:predicted anti-sigma-YlaC factor YlaD